MKTTKKISESEKEMLLTTHANDIRVYDDDEYKEWWIGENGTTTIKVIWQWDGEEPSMVDLGMTIDELRRDPIFISALLNDADVNHSLPLHNNPIPEDEFKRLLEWLTGRTNEMPITACGASNYYFDYIQPNR